MRIFGGHEKAREWSDDRIIQELLKVPKGVLIGMFMETGKRVCQKERIPEDIFWHFLFEHQIAEANTLIRR